MKKIICHVDCDYFFAQCEERRNPKLEGKPVVVCVYSGRTIDSGAVGTANYPARALGIHSGMPIFLAKKKASVDTVFLPVDHMYYSKVSEKIIGIAEGFADALEKASIDEAVLDISEKSGGNYSKAKEICQNLKQEILHKTGITVSIGIGPNKLVAKIACSMQKPNGLTVVEESKVREFLNPLEVSEIPGVGKKTAEALKSENIATIKELSLVGLEKLVTIFGKSKGKFLHNAARGIDERQIEPQKEKKRISIIRTLKQDAFSKEEMSGFLAQTSHLLFARALEEKVSFKTVFIIAIDKSLQLHTKAMTMPMHSSSEKDILECTQKLFSSFFEQKQGIGLRRAGIGVTGFLGAVKQKTLSEF